MTSSVVTLSDVWWKYEGSADWVLRGVDLEVDKGEFLTIMGPTGAGKTTLSMCLNGLIPNSVQGEMKGNVTIDGMNTHEHRPAEISSRMGLIFQDPESQFVGMSLEDDIAFGLINLGLANDEISRRIKTAISTVGLEEYLNKSPDELSGGQKQRAAIASVLAMSPQVICLDEPDSMLDPVGKREIFSILNQLKNTTDVTIILISHLSEEIAKYSDRILLLVDGRVQKQGNPEAFFSDVEYLKQNSVIPPQITEICSELKCGDRGKTPVTPEVGFPQLLEHLRRARVTPQAIEQTSDGPVSTIDPVIVVDKLSHVYQDGTQAVRGVDLIIREGEFTAIVGQNGSGKTTLCKHFNGLLTPSKGTVLVKGHDTQHTSISLLATMVGYAFQNPDHQICKFTVKEEVELGPRQLGLAENEIAKRRDRWLKFFDLDSLSNENPFFLSKAQRRNLAVASVLAMEPSILVVDEPTSGMDREQAYDALKVLEQLNKLGTTVVIVTHEIWLVAEFAKRIILMSKGEIIADGNVKQILSQPELLQRGSIEDTQVGALCQYLRLHRIQINSYTVKDFVSQVSEVSK